MVSRLSNREKILLIALLVTGVLVFYYYYLYIPVHNEIDKYSSEKEMYVKRLYKELALVRQLPGLREKYNRLKEIEKIELKFSSLTPEDFLELIEKISRESGTNLTAYFPEIKKEYTELDITVRGRYSDLNSFLAGLKKLANQLVVNTLTIRPDGDVLEMKLVLHYYEKKPTGGDLS